MTGKTEADSIESLIEELKNAVRIESCDKEDELPCLDVHFNTFNNSIDDKTPTAELQDDSKIGYVLLDTTPPPNPISGSVTYSETQSISSFCDSHLCPSCESAGYESESSESLTKHKAAPVHPLPTLITTRISSLPKTLAPHSHQNDNFHNTSHNSHISSNHTEHNDAGSSDHDYRLPYSAVRVRDRDTASESTSGISSQSHELKTCFTSMTSDSETQTDGDPALKDDQSESSGTTGTGAEKFGGDQKFYLDRYTHLTKRRRDKGIPNVAKWFGMSAVEHLIQHSIDCNKWMWNEEPNTPENEVKVGHRVPDRLDLNKARSKSEPVPLNQLKCQDRQDSRYLQVMSDVGPCKGDKDSLSSKDSSPRVSIHSLDDFNRKKKTNGWAQKISNSRTTCTEKLPKIKKSCLKKLHNGVKSSKESLEEKRKNNTLAEMLNEDLNGDDVTTADAAEKKKKKASRGGGTRRMGGSGMMKCALFDEFVDLSGKGPEPELSSGGRPTAEEGRPKARVARSVQGSDASKGVPR